MHLSIYLGFDILLDHMSHVVEEAPNNQEIVLEKSGDLQGLSALCDDWSVGLQYFEFEEHFCNVAGSGIASLCFIVWMQMALQPLIVFMSIIELQRHAHKATTKQRLDNLRERAKKEGKTLQELFEEDLTDDSDYESMSSEEVGRDKKKKAGQTNHSAQGEAGTESPDAVAVHTTVTTPAAAESTPATSS
jgi:hypothetical protein